MRNENEIILSVREEEQILLAARAIKRQRLNPTGRKAGRPEVLRPCGTCREMFSSAKLREHIAMCNKTNVINYENNS